MEYNTFSIYSTRKELFSKEKSINLDNEKSNQNKIKYILQLILSRGINEKLEKKICCLQCHKSYCHFRHFDSIFLKIVT